MSDSPDTKRLGVGCKVLVALTVLATSGLVVGAALKYRERQREDWKGVEALYSEAEKDYRSAEAVSFDDPAKLVFLKEASGKALAVDERIEAMQNSGVSLSLMGLSPDRLEELRQELGRFRVVLRKATAEAIASVGSHD